MGEFPFPNAGHIDSNSVFFILLHRPSAYFITFIRMIVPTLRTLQTANEKSRKTPLTPLDAISTLLSETRSNSFMLPSSRFANGISFHAISFTTIPIWQIVDLSVQCNAETEVMASNTQHYPALYVIFALLNAVRRGVPRKDIWREFRRQKITLKPRLSFWVSICRQAGLLSHAETLTVTRQARAWLNKSPEEQTFDLIEAWQSAPKNIEARRFRKKLLWKLKYGQPPVQYLTQKDLGAMYGLEALGLCNEGGLTAWGRRFIKNEGTLPTP